MSTRPRATSRTRAESKCDYCRERKIKCLPETRDFSTGQLCEACRKSHLPCGPNVPKPRARPTAGIPLASPPTQPEQPNLISVYGERRRPARSREPLIHNPPSSSLTPPLILRTSNSPDEYPTVGISDSSQDPRQKCRRYLSKMGSMVDLDWFIYHRYRSLTTMEKRLPLFDKIIEVEAPMKFLLNKVGDYIIRYYHRVDQYMKHFTRGSSDWENTGRRMVSIGQSFLDLHASESDSPLKPMQMFQNTHAGLKQDLCNFYREIPDHAAADRIQVPRGQYLDCCPPHILDQVALRISSAMQEVLGELDAKDKDTLSLTEPIHITKSHLALMSSRPIDRINPADFPPTSGTGLTGRNTIHLAAEGGNAPYLLYHLETTPDSTTQFLSERDFFRLTPIMVAAYSGNLGVFQALCDKGAVLSEQIPGGRNVLSLACMAADIPIIREILKRGGTVQDHIRYCSPLHDAIEAGRYEVVKLLIDEGVDPDLKFNNWSPLEWAIEKDQSRIADLFCRSSSEAASRTDHDSARPLRKRKLGHDTQESRHREAHQVEFARNIVDQEHTYGTSSTLFLNHQPVEDYPDDWANFNDDSYMQHSETMNNPHSSF